eukprot:scaffold17500_cov126-Isochrysis_galbana.AAC.1
MADSTTMGTPASTWSPALALTSKTTPGMGAPTDPTTPGTAFSRFTCARSRGRGWGLGSVGGGVG